MLHFDLALDPNDLPVRFYREPLATIILVIGDFLARPDPNPIEDRKPTPITLETFDKVRAAHKSSAPIWDQLRSLLEDVPAAARFEVLNASNEDLACDFDDAPKLSKSGYYKTVNPYNHQGMRPYSLVVHVDPVQDGRLLQQMAAVGQAKNVPILVSGNATIDSTKPEARYVVPCPTGTMQTARAIVRSFLGDDMPPQMKTYAGTELSSLLLLSWFGHQLLHIDHRREIASQKADEQTMTDMLNAGLSARLRNAPGVSALVSAFEWKSRPFAEATLCVTTPMFHAQDKIVLQFEYW